MDPISGALAAAWADARLAATPGAIGDAPDRPGELVAHQVIPSGPDSFVRSSSPLSVAIDGAGWFALDDNGRQVYSRLGDFRVDSSGVLVDASGRRVMGRSLHNGITDAAIRPITVGRSDAKVTSAIEIDPTGTVIRRTGSKVEALARIVLATFPAPERLRRLDESTVDRSGRSGAPSFSYPGSANVGTIRSHELESAFVDLRGDLAQLWRLGRRGEYLSTCAYAADRCERVALDLVK